MHYDVAGQQGAQFRFGGKGAAGKGRTSLYNLRESCEYEQITHGKLILWNSIAF